MKQDVNHCLRMTKEDQRMIKHLCKKFGENKTACIRRAINYLYSQITIQDYLKEGLNDFKTKEISGFELTK